MILFYLLAGVSIGQLLYQWAGVTALLVTWLVFTTLIPAVLQSITEQRGSPSLNNYTLETEKLNIVSAFEKNLFKTIGPFNRNNIEVGRNRIEGYWKKDYHDIESLELNSHRDVEISTGKN